MGERVVAKTTAPEYTREKSKLVETVRRAPSIAHGFKPAHCVKSIKLLIARPRSLQVNVSTFRKLKAENSNQAFSHKIFNAKGRDEHTEKVISLFLNFDFADFGRRSLSLQEPFQVEGGILEYFWFGRAVKSP